MRANVLIVAVLVLASCAGAPVKRRASAREAYDDGVAFLLKRQNPDGSFSHGGRTTGFDVPMGSPESHRAFKVACTALCVMALRDNPEAAEARSRAIDWLLAQGKTNRALPGELYNVWTHIYVVHALSEDPDLMWERAKTPSGNQRQKTIAWNLRMLERYESMWGGWQYYDWLGSQHPALEPTSFTTASALVAMHAAKEAGIEVHPNRAIRIVEECRNPDGSYNYDWARIPRPQAEINKKKGNISRAQACNHALWLWGRAGVTRERVIADLELFFREHKWLDVARKRPIPHEGWYAHAGYFYYYSHWYASRNIVRLGADGERFRQPLFDAILPHQEADGSWWDFPDYTYDVFYGTAQALLALQPFVSR